MCATCSIPARMGTNILDDHFMWINPVPETKEGTVSNVMAARKMKIKIVVYEYIHQSNVQIIHSFFWV